MPGLQDVPGVHSFTFSVAGQSTAATNDDFVGPVIPFACQVTAVYWTPAAAITADGTNYFDLTLQNGSTVVATRSYIATNSVALTKESMTLSATAANLLLAAGDVITAKKTKAASGLAMPDGSITVEVQAI